MRVYTLLFFGLLAGGCGSPHVDPFLVPYFHRFVAEGELRGKHVDVSGVGGKFVPFTEPGTKGDCDFSPFEHTINISQHYWELDVGYEGYVRREMVLFHELGHCALGRSHIDVGYALDNKILTLMISSTDMIGVNEYLYKRTEYLNELFK